jgi:hypothetical protein
VTHKNVLFVFFVKTLYFDKILGGETTGGQTIHFAFVSDIK